MNIGALRFYFSPNSWERTAWSTERFVLYWKGFKKTGKIQPDLNRTSPWRLSVVKYLNQFFPHKSSNKHMFGITCNTHEMKQKLRSNILSFYIPLSSVHAELQGTRCRPSYFCMCTTGLWADASWLLSSHIKCREDGGEAYAKEHLFTG